jgi:hypothetical protein
MTSHRIIEHISVEVRITAIEQDRVLGCPTAGFRIVVPGAKARQLAVRIVQPTGKAEGLESGVRVQRNVAELVVVCWTARYWPCDGAVTFIIGWPVLSTNA